MLSALPDAAGDEKFDTLLARPGVRILRIVSDGQVSPPGEWLDQDDAEWVIVLAGRAMLLFDGESDIRLLEPGGYAFLPANCRHRVEWTDPETPTVWLAVHMALIIEG
jgi:cupin 2 domain-containing protein